MRYAHQTSARNELRKIIEIREAELMVEYLQHLHSHAINLEQVEYSLGNLRLDFFIGLECSGFQQIDNLLANRAADSRQFLETGDTACLNQIGKRRLDVFNGFRGSSISPNLEGIVLSQFHQTG